MLLKFEWSTTFRLATQTDIKTVIYATMSNYSQQHCVTRFIKFWAFVFVLLVFAQNGYSIKFKHCKLKHPIIELKHKFKSVVIIFAFFVIILIAKVCAFLCVSCDIEKCIEFILVSNFIVISEKPWLTIRKMTSICGVWDVCLVIKEWILWIINRIGTSYGVAMDC